jgi:hypothetical protein
MKNKELADLFEKNKASQEKEQGLPGKGERDQRSWYAKAMDRFERGLIGQGASKNTVAPTSGT